MEAEEFIEAAADGGQEKVELAAANIPSDVLLDLSRTYGAELLTATLGALGIVLVNKGSSQYARAAETSDSGQAQELVREASANILLGASAMTMTAAAAGNPLFAYPEAIIVLTSLKPYLESRYPQIEALLTKCKATAILTGTALAGGVVTISTYAQDVGDALPAAGLSALGAAFTIGNDETRQGIYRALTLSGGSALLVGSTLSLQESVQQHNSVGAVMSGVFLALNVLFTSNEFKEARKLPAVQKVIDSVKSAFTKK